MQNGGNAWRDKLAQIEKRQPSVETRPSSSEDDIPIVNQIQAQTNEEGLVKHKDVGMNIARDFGKKGVFLGKVVAVEYDSEDVDKNEDIFVVEYTDGDREDMNKEELVYANEFYNQVSGIDDESPEGSLHTESGESESYKPSPPVSSL